MKYDIAVKEDELDNVYKDIKGLIVDCKKRIYSTVNTEMLNLYWNIGKTIVSIQGGEKRAKYGQYILKELAIKLTNEFGKGFSLQNLKRMRQFYNYFEIGSSLMSQLTWTHYLELMKIKEEEKRNFYFHECINSRWSVRELQREIKSYTYERLSVNSKNNRDKLTNNGLVVSEMNDLIKEPYVLEFLKMEKDKFTEKELEDKIIEHLKEFLLELGKSFMYVGRQQRIDIEGVKYYPDLVFYNNIVKGYLIIDLKVGKLTHKDIGQMLMYVNYYDSFIKSEDDSETFGIILCKDKNKTIIKYTLGDIKANVYASKYMLHLPSEDELIRVVEDNI